MFSRSVFGGLCWWRLIYEPRNANFDYLKGSMKSNTIQATECEESDKRQIQDLTSLVLPNFRLDFDVTVHVD